MRERGGGGRAPPATRVRLCPEPGRRRGCCSGGASGTQPPLLPPPPRVPWAEARAKFFSRGKNRASLDCIDRAAFFLALDEEAQGYSPEREESLSDYAKSLLHGHCDDR